MIIDSYTSVEGHVTLDPVKSEMLIFIIISYLFIFLTSRSNPRIWKNMPVLRLKYAVILSYFMPVRMKLCQTKQAFGLLFSASLKMGIYRFGIYNLSIPYFFPQRHGYSLIMRTFIKLWFRFTLPFIQTVYHVKFITVSQASKKSWYSYYLSLNFIRTIYA